MCPSSAFLLLADPEWLRQAWTAEYAWASLPVRAHQVPEQDQHFLDLHPNWAQSYHWRSRSAAPGDAPKLLRRLFGSYATTCRDAKGTFLARPDGPLVQLSDEGFKLAGQIIEVKWESAWRVTWENVPAEYAHPRWASGTILFATDRLTASGTAGALDSPVAERERWSCHRSRIVGGKGGISLYSKRRRRRADPAAARGLPFAPTNRQDYSAPLTRRLAEPRPDVVVGESWDDDVLTKGTHGKILKWIKRATVFIEAVLRAAPPDADKNTPPMSTTAVAKLHQVHRAPQDLVLFHSHLNSRLLSNGRDGGVKGKLHGMLFRRQDGKIVHRRSNDPPPHHCHVDAVKVRELDANCVNSWNRSMFDNLDQGWTHDDSHSTDVLATFKQYPGSLYSSYWNFQAAVVKTIDPQGFPHCMPPPVMDLPCLPYMVADRAMIPKKDTAAMRQIVNHSLEQGLKKWAARACNAVAAKAIKEERSYNDRIKAVQKLLHGPHMQLSKGADVGHNAYILLSYELVIVLITYDASGYFHCFKVGGLRCSEQGVVTVWGLTYSASLDMGVTDAPDCSGQMSNFIRHAVGLALDQILRTHPAIANNKNACIYRAEREAIFGVGSEHTWWAAPSQYSDDLTVTSLEGTSDAVHTVVMKLGGIIGLRWHIEKYGVNMHIGYAFDFCSVEHGTQHVRAEKLLAYIEHCTEVKSKDFEHNKSIDSLLGQLGHAASTNVEIKQHTARLTAARNLKISGLTREVTHITAGIKQDLEEVVTIMQSDVGLPLLCDFYWPDHGADSTITIRTDACLNEGWNGFGIWIIIPSGAEQPPAIIAMLSEWTTTEQAALGHNTPAAEAIGLLVAHRVVRRRKLWSDHHKDLLALTDSETSSMKLGTLRMGSTLMDAIRDAWLEVDADIPLNGVCDYIPRDYNVGSDLLSKNRWDLFCETLRAAGLPAPTLVNIHAEDRDVSTLLRGTNTTPDTETDKDKETEPEPD